MQGNDGAASLHCVSLRVAQLNAQGVPATGNQLYVTDSLVQLGFNPEVETGPESITRNAAGALCVVYKLPDIVKRLTMTVDICTPDPELEEVLAGGTIYVSGGNVAGYQYPHVGTEPNPNGVSIEAWTHAVVDSQLTAQLPYMHWVFPRVFNLKHTNRMIDINPLASSFTGYGGENNSWGSGPAADWAFDSTAVAQWTRVSSYPTPQVGMQLVGGGVPAV